MAPDSDAAPAGGESGQASRCHQPASVLLLQHLRLLEDSGISPEVAAERGYESITVKAKLKSLGFSEAQCNVPALHLPIWGVDGSVVGRQLRPDHPRVDAKGKIRKYETPKGMRMALDVHPRVRKVIRDPSIPLVITEGIRKADSAVSRGIDCIALIGVWNWRGTNEDGGKTALPDWESIAIKGRLFYIAFDSDVTVKSAVREAMRRLKEFLEQRGATVKIIYFDSGPNGEKVGLDDFLVKGKTMEDLVALARSELPPRPAEESLPFMVATEYRVLPNGTAKVEVDEELGETLRRLANFSASVSKTVIEDDGVTTTQAFELSVRLGSVTREVRVPAAEFGAMNWVTEKLGPKYVVDAGFSTRDHLRAAIQNASQDHAVHRVFTHTGWRGEGGDWIYLHGGGAIGREGLLSAVSVSLPTQLESFVLPEPPQGDALRSVVLAVLNLLLLTSDTIIFTILGAAFRAVIGSSDFSLYLSGASGIFKSELAALIQALFGPKFDSRHLPGSWSSTANALEALAFVMKDAVFVVDDYAPQGSAHDVAQAHRTADRLLRSQGNNAGRQRMNADSSLRQSKCPRGMVLSTGEDIPPGHSLRARMLVLELREGDIKSAALTLCQRDASSGLYAQAMSAFLRWLAPQYSEIESRMRASIDAFRASAADAGVKAHARMSDTAAQILFGFEMFTEFAKHSIAIDDDECVRLRVRAREAVLRAIASQEPVQAASDPVPRFLELLRAAILSGRAHLTDASGQPPKSIEKEFAGWQMVHSKDGEIDPAWQCRGTRVGWVLSDGLFLIPSAAFQAAQSMADDGGRLVLSAKTLGKRLSERGMLLSEDRERRRHTIKKQIGKARPDVLHLDAALILESPQSPPSPHRDQRPEDDAQTVAEEPGDSEPDAPLAGEHQPTGTTTEGAIGAIPQQDLVASPRRDEVQRTCYKCSGVQLWRLKDANEQICAHCYPPAVDLDLVDWLPKPIESEALDVPVDVESTVGDAGSEQCHAH